MTSKRLRRADLVVLGQRGAASVEYLVTVMVVAFAAWAAVSEFGQAAIQGIKLAGSDLLGLH